MYATFPTSLGSHYRLPLRRAFLGFDFTLLYMGPSQKIWYTWCTSHEIVSFK
jgi:hypothetical protein